MYNDQMPNRHFEIRSCRSCGLRYPLLEGHPFGVRCPSCTGDTRLILRGELRQERELGQPTSQDGAGEHDRTSIAVLLDNIRSAWNVGSILRSADGFGFSHAFLCGITPSADNQAVTKTSLGAEESLPWSYHGDAVQLARGLKAAGWIIFGLEEERRAVEISQASLHKATRSNSPVEGSVLVVGNEVTGIDPALLDLCDEVLFIPMRGAKKSFNVAIAFGIAAYALTRRRPAG